MKPPTTISHPLRVIAMQYNGSKPLSDFEEKALKEYLILHTILHESLKQFDAMNVSLFKLERELDELEHDLLLLEAELNRCEFAEGCFGKEGEKINALKECAEVTEMVRQAFAHQEKMNAHYAALRQLEEDAKKWDADADLLDVDIENYDEAFATPIIQNWEQMEIDTCTYDDDLQEFYGIVDELFLRKSPQFNKTWNTFMDNYNGYIEKVNLIFDRVKILQQKATNIVFDDLKKNISDN